MASYTSLSYFYQLCSMIMKGIIRNTVARKLSRNKDACLRWTWLWSSSAINSTVSIWSEILTAFNSHRKALLSCPCMALATLSTSLRMSSYKFLQLMNIFLLYRITVNFIISGGLQPKKLAVIICFVFQFYLSERAYLDSLLPR